MTDLAGAVTVRVYVFFSCVTHKQDPHTNKPRSCDA